MTTRPNPSPTPYIDGRRAAKHGAASNTNPYSTFDYRNKQWSLGWDSDAESRPTQNPDTLLHDLCGSLMCDIPPNGQPETPKSIYALISAITTTARKALGEGPIKATLHSFRHDRHEMVMLDLSSPGGHHNIIFTAGYPHDFEWGEPQYEEIYIPDLVEAIHLVGMVLQALNAVVECIGLPSRVIDDPIYNNDPRLGTTNTEILNQHHQGPHESH